MDLPHSYLQAALCTLVAIVLYHGVDEIESPMMVY